MNTMISSNDVYFICKQFSISEDPDFGCTIDFSDTIYDGSSTVNSAEKYLFIERIYPEDEDDVECYTVETSANDIELNPKDKIIIDLKWNLIKISWSGNTVNIGLELVSSSEIHDLKKVCREVFKDKIILID